MKYFEGLNALRFMAAILVAISHSASSISSRKLNYLFNFESFSLFQNGSIAVEFFFVLSGFLITSLLLDELNKKGTIEIRKFYLRRVLRIWPLYYLIVLFYFFIAPLLIAIFSLSIETNLSWSQFILYLFFLPNVVRVIFPYTILSPLWSIGVEEQFYLFWAPLIRCFKNRLITIFVGLILIKFTFNILFLNETSIRVSSSWEVVVQFINHLKFESMAIGGIGAVLIQRKNIVNRCPLFKFIMQVPILSIIFILLFVKPLFLNMPFGNIIFNDTAGIIIRSFLFLYLILNVSLNKRSFIKLRNGCLNKLGNISYGIYMYHISVEVLLLNFMKPLFTFENIMVSTLLYFVLFIGLTILVSFLSYQLFEKSFLKLKLKI
ncbi:MAG TPA: acyltransferase [Chitinophagaceae bacterium]|nr:acyltransferase [Chitinophagaceae bacterium]